jgi:hypothetical protein
LLELSLDWPIESDSWREDTDPALEAEVAMLSA